MRCESCGLLLSIICPILVHCRVFVLLLGPGWQPSPSVMQHNYPGAIAGYYPLSYIDNQSRLSTTNFYFSWFAQFYSVLSSRSFKSHRSSQEDNSTCTITGRPSLVSQGPDCPWPGTGVSGSQLKEAHTLLAGHLDALVCQGGQGIELWPGTQSFLTPPAAQTLSGTPRIFCPVGRICIIWDKRHRRRSTLWHGTKPHTPVPHSIIFCISFKHVPFTFWASLAMPIKWTFWGGHPSLCHPARPVLISQPNPACPTPPCPASTSRPAWARISRIGSKY